MRIVSLTNPWSGADVTITEDEAAKIDERIEAFGTDEEKYISQERDGIKLIEELIEEFGVDRVSEIWFSG